MLTRLLANPDCQFLEYADFKDIDNFDNECLRKLTEKCPNLKHLNVTGSRIQGDALKHLENTPNLQSLDIGGCTQLESDALKHVEHMRNLQSLDISHCYKLEKDALKHVENMPNLQSLDICGCTQLEKDALKHVENMRNLQSLDISWFPHSRGCPQTSGKHTKSES